ncbi:hypothetical protein [Sphingomonas sp. PAMC 26617]|uniref:hypothetical protein n=1 Tax=Sphingomonas sp. PAMC 26617 TaxID=1112216 RepID=UPI0002891987|nr:hypothetical protein [Sphingomonas sp. PAMC 26617]
MNEPFAVTPAQRIRADPRFPPVAATQPVAATVTVPRTSVQIVATADYAIELVATFAAADPAGGQALVAGLQTVDTTVTIDFTSALPLWWFAAVQKAGEIAANTTACAYSSNSDIFQMQLNKSITLTHDGTGWHIPTYDGTLYTVSVGFGLGAEIVYFAYAAVVSPMTSVLINAGGYELARSSGAQTIGSTITADQESWIMPLGGAYRLTFDSSGDGTLSNR